MDRSNLFGASPDWHIQVLVYLQSNYLQNLVSDWWPTLIILLTQQQLSQMHITTLRLTHQPPLHLQLLLLCLQPILISTQTRKLRLCNQLDQRRQGKCMTSRMLYFSYLSLQKFICHRVYVRTPKDDDDDRVCSFFDNLDAASLDVSVPIYVLYSHSFSSSEIQECKLCLQTRTTQCGIGGGSCLISCYYWVVPGSYVL